MVEICGKLWLRPLSEDLFSARVSLGVSETVKFVARHTKLSDLLRIFNLARALSHLRGEKAENHIFLPSLETLGRTWP